MCIAKIIAPLAGTKHDRDTLKTAFAAAKPFNAHVEALFVHPDPRLVLPYYTGVPISPDVVQSIMDAAGMMNAEAARVARTAFDDEAAAANVVKTAAPKASQTATCSFLELEGYFPTIVAEASRLSDLVVFGTPGAADSPDIADAFAETLIKTERPVLFAGHVPSRFPGKAIVAWDGSATATRALIGAMPFLHKAREIVLLSCRHQAQAPKTGFADVSRYLAAHHLSCREEIVDPGSRAIGEALLDGAIKGEADLLIMGGYGHSRLGEAIFGGVTQHVRWHASMPVLMIH